MFKVKKKTDNSVRTVYDVEMLVIQNSEGKPSPVPVFLTYDSEKNEWVLEEAGAYEPIDTTVELGSNEDPVEIFA